MTDKAIEAAAFDKAMTQAPCGSPQDCTTLPWKCSGCIEAQREFLAAYEAALGPINPGPIADMVNENVRLRAQVERMREALEPFSSFADVYDEASLKALGVNPKDYELGDDRTFNTGGRFGTPSYRALTVGHLRAARAAMEG